MAFDFPTAPVVGQEFASPGGPVYVFDGVAWRVPTSGTLFPSTPDGIVDHQTITSDANFTLTPLVSPRETLHTGTLTANRTVTLPTTDAYAGMVWRVSRIGGGDFTLDVGGLAALETNQWAEVVFSNSAWVLAARGWMRDILYLDDDGALMGPELPLMRHTDDPAVSDILGQLSFYGRNNAGEKTLYAFICPQLVDVADGTEDATLLLGVMRDGTAASTLAVGKNAITLSPTSGNAVFNTNSDANVAILMGSNTGNTGGQWFAYGQSHPTDANDLAGFSGGASKMRYDASDGQWEIPVATPVDHGTWSATGASAGTKITGGLITSSATGTGSTTHQAYYNPNGNVGGIATAASGTTFATTSDERLKDFIGEYDPQKAIAIIRADPVRDWLWKVDGEYAIGWGAQTSYAISKDLAVRLQLDPNDPEKVSWGTDQGKRTPYLWAALSWALDKIEELESRLEALEG